MSAILDMGAASAEAYMNGVYKYSQGFADHRNASWGATKRTMGAAVRTVNDNVWQPTVSGVARVGNSTRNVLTGNIEVKNRLQTKRAPPSNASVISSEEDNVFDDDGRSVAETDLTSISRRPKRPKPSFSSRSPSRSEEVMPLLAPQEHPDDISSVPSISAAPSQRTRSSRVDPKSSRRPKSDIVSSWTRNVLPPSVTDVQSERDFDASEHQYMPLERDYAESPLSQRPTKAPKLRSRMMTNALSHIGIGKTKKLEQDYHVMDQKQRDLREKQIKAQQQLVEEMEKKARRKATRAHKAAVDSDFMEPAEDYENQKQPGFVKKLGIKKKRDPKSTMQALDTSMSRYLDEIEKLQRLGVDTNHAKGKFVDIQRRRHMLKYVNQVIGAPPSPSSPLPPPMVPQYPAPESVRSRPRPLLAPESVKSRASQSLEDGAPLVQYVAKGGEGSSTGKRRRRRPNRPRNGGNTQGEPKTGGKRKRRRRRRAKPPTAA